MAARAGPNGPAPSTLRAEAVRCGILLFLRLVLLFPNLLTIAFTSQRLFYTLLLTRLQIKGVPLDLFDDVLGLNLAFETSQRVLKGFALLNSNLCQENTPHDRANRLPLEYAMGSKLEQKSQATMEEFNVRKDSP